MSDETRVTLRLPNNVHAVVKRFADLNARSMNEEIVTVLSTHYDMSDDLRRRVERLESFIATLKPTTQETPAHENHPNRNH